MPELETKQTEMRARHAKTTAVERAEKHRNEKKRAQVRQKRWLLSQGKLAYTEANRRFYIRHRIEQARADVEAEGLTYDGLHCDVCSISLNDKPEVDHDHRTNYIRGLLCGACNKALGFMQDNPMLLRRLLDYRVKAAQRANPEIVDEEDFPRIRYPYKFGRGGYMVDAPDVA